MDHDNRSGKDVETLKNDISELREDLTGIAQTLIEKGKTGDRSCKG